MVYSGGRYVNYRYNAEGSLAELDYGEGDAAPTATYRFEYDSLGRLIRSQQRDGNTVTQRTEQLYDTANRLSAQDWTIGGTSYRESYAYDASDGSLTTLNTAVGTKIGYNYDALKRLRSRAIYQGSTPLFENRYAYATQSGNQSTALVEFFNYRLASDDGNGDIIVGYQYEYDKGGNITDIKAEVDGALIPLEHYEYDEKQGQLKEAIRYENGVEADRWTYSYDTAGNILSEDHEGSNSELHEYAYEDGRWGDLLTSVDGIDLEYDGSGNPTFYANGTELLWNMEWQNGRQLSHAATERDSTTEDVLDFAYDANGIRTSKTVTRNTYRPVQTYKVTFVADGKTVKTMNVTEGYTLKDSDYPAVPEKAGYTGAWQRYPSPVQSNVTVSATYTKITTYYTVTFVADGFTVKTMQVYSGYKLKDSDYPSVPEKLRYEGTWQKYTAAVTSNVTVQATYRKMLPLQVQFYVVAQYTYDAWGNILDSGGNLAEVNPLRYRGYYYDNETGFYYLQSRYYDPANRRFMNADIYASTDSNNALACNMYSYCWNNVVILYDSEGELPKIVTILDVQTHATGTDNDIGAICFATTITYTETFTVNSFFWTVYESSSTYTNLYEFKLTPNGVLQFDNTQVNANDLLKSQISECIASEMLRVSREVYPDALSNRSVRGIANELVVHYLLSNIVERAKIADMGDTKKTARGYDRNAWIFEALN